MRISHSGRRPVIITGGDPSGIGPEVILKSLRYKPLARIISPVIIGDAKVFERAARRLNLTVPGEGLFIDLANVSSRKFRYGVIDRDYGRASMEYVSCAVAASSAFKNAPVVTAPIHKESVRKAGYKEAGHTEYLAKLTGKKDVTMMLAGRGIRVSLVTRHLALKDASRHVTKSGIMRTARDTRDALRRLFGVRNPRIAVAALNPHGGEGGYLGTEEKRIIAPAVRALRKKIRNIHGPLPADTLFHKIYAGEFDAIVCMYHDQGLIPLKMVAFDTGVNITLGLPFLRTSPDHGTGFDIAGKGTANPSSMIAALTVAARAA